MSRHLAAHGLTGAPSQYALIDNARRARLKQTRQEYAAAMGALFAPFTKVAAANPHAAAPVERSAAELVTPTETNRPIADPYTRYIVAREKVNQGAAVLLTSVAAARRLGIPAGPVGVPARPRGPARTGPDGPRRPVGRPGVGHGRAACPRPGGHRRRRNWPRSTCTAAFPRRSSTSATGWALTPKIRAASPSPAACRSSAAPATTTPCTPSPRPSSGPAARPAATDWSAPTAAS